MVLDVAGQSHQPESRRNNEIISNYSDGNMPQMLKNYCILCPILDSEVWAGIWAAKKPTSGSADLKRLFSLYGGESGIRTHGTVSRTHAFQACALSHSAISPGALS
jgi:hypothetical protein